MEARAVALLQRRHFQPCSPEFLVEDAASSSPPVTTVVAPAPAPRQASRGSFGQSFLAIGVLMLVGGAAAGVFGSLLGLGGGVLIVPLLIVIEPLLTTVPAAPGLHRTATT